LFTKPWVLAKVNCPGVYGEPGPLKTCQTGFEPPGHQGGIIGPDGKMLISHCRLKVAGQEHELSWGAEVRGGI